MWDVRLSECELGGDATQVPNNSDDMVYVDNSKLTPRDYVAIKGNAWIKETI